MKGERKISIIREISAIYRYSQIYIGERTKKYHIGKGQWHFLTELLFNEDGITQEELSEKLYIDKANTARALKKLEGEGYIERKVDSDDARKKRIYVTDKSRAFEEEFHQIFKDLNKLLVADFTEDEKLLMKKLLPNMFSNIKKANE